MEKGPLLVHSSDPIYASVNKKVYKKPPGKLGKRYEVIQLLNWFDDEPYFGNYHKVYPLVKS